MIRKLLCVLIALCLCAGCACAEEDHFVLSFDEGFSLLIPSGWVSYPAGDGVIRYALGDAGGQHLLYILLQPTELEDFDQMRQAIEERDDCGKTSPLELDGRPFAAFISTEMNASGCAMLMDGQVLIFLFTPQSDSDYMLTAAEIMASIRF